MTQLRLFADGYGLDAGGRRALFPKMIEYAIRDSAAEAIQVDVTPDCDDVTALWAIAWRARGHYGTAPCSENAVIA